MTAAVEPTTTETEDEAGILYAHLLAERVDANTPELTVSQKALLHMAAQLMAIRDPAKAGVLTDLLERAPRVLRAGARPAPTLQDVCRADAPWDLTRLSHQQLTHLEEISATAQGRACPVASPRLEAGLALTAHLDADTDVDMPRVRGLLLEVLAPLTFEDVHPSHRDAPV